MTAEFQEGESDAWPWPDACDALRAAPHHHALLFENERVRVLETRIPPGDLVPVHPHRWPSVFYIISSSDFIRLNASGEVEVDSRLGGRGAPASIVWSEPLPPHSLENVGTTGIRVVSVELKPIRGPDAPLYGSVSGVRHLPYGPLFGRVQRGPEHPSHLSFDHAGSSRIAPL